MILIAKKFFHFFIIKTIFFFIAFAFLFISYFPKADQLMLYTETYSLLNGVNNFGFVWKAVPQLGLFAQYSYTNLNDQNIYALGTVDVFTGGISYSLSGDLFQSGWTLSPQLAFVNLDLTIQPSGVKNTGFIFGCSAGYHWYIHNQLMIGIETIAYLNNSVALLIPLGITF